ncbi:hypothetical protein M1D96_11190 [Pseudomonas sp. D1-3]
MVGAQGLIEHGAAPVDVIAQQMTEPLSVGGAAGPAQQGDLLGHIEMGALAQARLRQLPGQPGDAHRMPQRLTHAQIADLGDGSQCRTRRNEK